LTTLQSATQIPIGAQTRFLGQGLPASQLGGAPPRSPFDGSAPRSPFGGSGPPSVRGAGFWPEAGPQSPVEVSQLGITVGQGLSDRRQSGAHHFAGVQTRPLSQALLAQEGAQKPPAVQVWLLGQLVPAPQLP
jgi:hypothetical protein